MQEKIVCGDGPCKYGKPICCLECYAFDNCPDGCVQQTCEVWEQKNEEEIQSN